METRVNDNGTQLIVSVENAAMVPNIRAAIKMLKGVTKITLSKPSSVTDCAAHKEAMKDIKEGRIYKASSIEDMFKDCLV